MMCRGSLCLACVAALCAGGCGAPAPDAGTGAATTAMEFFGAVVGSRWEEAYELLDVESRKRVSAAQFAELAAQYRRQLGFEPESVKVRACEEHGDEAAAHIVVSGRLVSRSRRYRDAVRLKKEGNAWRVMLPVRRPGSRKGSAGLSL